MQYDIGGSYAIRGFNYQKAVIAYIALLNYQKNNFCILPENRDDAEISVDDRKVFVQIKSEALSIKKLVTQGKSSKQSVLGKLFRKYCDRASYKIVTTSLFTASDKKFFEPACGILLPCDVFRCSTEQKNLIHNHLKSESYTDEQLNIYLDNVFIALSPFGNNYQNAMLYLLGFMADKNIRVDGNRGRTALTELFTQIDTKSEIVPDGSVVNMMRKQITKDDIERIFINTDKEEPRTELRKELLEECQLSKKLKYAVQKEFFNLYTIRRNLKNRLQRELGEFTIANDNEVAQIKKMYLLACTDSKDSAAIYAVIIDIVADKILE